MTSPLEFAPAAVLFDMDGLLIESERALLQCWRDSARELELVLDDALWLSFVGLSDRVCHEILHQRVGDADTVRALLAAVKTRYDKAVETGLPLKPGVMELLDLLDLHRIPRAVATSTHRKRAMQKLDIAGLLPKFDAVVAGDEVAQAKPAPDIYLHAAQRLGVVPSRCIVLEDSGPGVRAALAAGMTPIQVPDLVWPDEAMHALGHRVVESLPHAHALIEPMLAASRSPRR